MTPIGVIGSVKGGLHPDMKVQVLEDAGSGGYHILKWWPESGGSGPDGAFDDWVESRAALEEYWHESGWRVHWGEATDAESSPTPA